MAKEKKIPKQSEKDKVLSGDAEATLYGILLLLISIIGLLNKGWVGEFLTYITVYLFGSFYFIFFILMIFLGIYLIAKKRFYRIKINLKLLGGILIIISCSIAASMSNDELSIANIFTYFNQQMAIVSDSSFHIESLVQVSASGGGIIGYFLCACLNSSITLIGTRTVVFVFMIVGLFLLFKDIFVRCFNVIKSFFAYIKNRRIKHNELKEAKKTEEKRNIIVQESETEVEHKAVEETPSYTKTVEIKQQAVKKTTPNLNELLKPLDEEEISVNKNERKLDSFSSIDMPIKDLFVDDFDDIKEINQDQVSTKKKFFQSLEQEKETPINSKPNISDSLFTNLETDVVNPTINERVREIKTEDDYSSRKIDIKPVYDNQVEQAPIIEENQDEHNTFDSSKYEETKPYTRIIKEEVKVEKKYIDRPYIYPSLSLLTDRMDGDKNLVNIRVADDRVEKINDLLEELKIGAQVVSYTIGPSVTRFDVRTNPGVRVNTLSSIQNEVAVKLGGNKTVRLEMVVEGKTTSGIEVGNEATTTVSFKECMNNMASSLKDKLAFPLGKDISGKVVKVNIDDLPHLLVAGTTGSGKSVFIHSIIMSLLMRTKPSECKLMLIDPKKVEFVKYREMPHLLCPIINDTNEAKVALKRLVDEMERRYELFAEKGRGATKYSEYIEVAKEQGYEIPPYIVVVCDEFADFMSTNSKEIEPLIQRIAQKARASGIYMIIATQRPSVNVITGDIKANIPSRVALSVSSFIDSRTIIDEGGAESLLGKGDMLARLPMSKSLIRVQSCYVDNQEIWRVVEYLKSQNKPNYDPNFVDLTEKVETGSFSMVTGKRTELDPMHEQVKRHVLETGIASTTNIQKNFGIGFAKADYILDCLIREGIVKRLPGGRKMVIKTLEEAYKDEEQNN